MLARALAWASPPRNRPTIATEKRSRRSVTPDVFIIRPTNKKPGMAMSVKESNWLIMFCEATVIGTLGFMSSQSNEAAPREKTTGIPRSNRNKNAPKIIAIVVNYFSSPFLKAGDSESLVFSVQLTAG